MPGLGLHAGEIDGRVDDAVAFIDEFIGNVQNLHAATQIDMNIASMFRSYA